MKYLAILMTSNRCENLKSIGDDVSIFSRLESYVVQMTLNSFGHAVIAAKIAPGEVVTTR